MTVQELIARLQDLPSTATVVVNDAITPYVLDRVRVSPQHHVDPFNVQPCRGEGCVLCVYATTDKVQAVVL